VARVYQPLQKKSTGRWDYTVSSDEEGWSHATGYCAGWTHPDEIDASSEKYGMPKMKQEERERRLQHKDKFHSDGHATAKEALACHREYELDFEIRFFEDKSTQKKCGVCDELTTGRASLGEFRRYVACPEHQTREGIMVLQEREDRRKETRA